MPIPVRTAATSRFEIATESGYVPVDIRRHPRARSYTLRVAGPGKPPILTMPERGSLAEAHRFLERHAGWLQAPDRPPAAGDPDCRWLAGAAAWRCSTPSTMIPAAAVR